VNSNNKIIVTTIESYCPRHVSSRHPGFEWCVMVTAGDGRHRNLDCAIVRYMGAAIWEHRVDIIYYIILYYLNNIIIITPFNHAALWIRTCVKGDGWRAEKLGRVVCVGYRRVLHVRWHGHYIMPISYKYNEITQVAAASAVLTRISGLTSLNSRPDEEFIGFTCT